MNKSFSKYVSKYKHMTNYTLTHVGQQVNQESEQAVKQLQWLMLEQAKRTINYLFHCIHPVKE